MGRKRYYCEYCEKHLTYGGPKSRKEHIRGKKHKEKMSEYYKRFEENILQKLIDQVVYDYMINGENTTTPIPHYTRNLSAWEKVQKISFQKFAQNIS
ncbi:Matrin-type domain-containing protein [Entamoeba marina]